MAISINPTLPVIAAQEAGGATPGLALQPGSVVDVQVLKVLSEDLVRIAIAGLSIDVLSQVPLQEGQALQLAVSQTRDGIRLAVVGQGADPAGVSPDAATLSPDAHIDAAATPSVIAAPPRDVLTPLERVVVSAAAQGAATEQGSLAPLFANLGAIAASGSLPPKLQQAVAQVLAQQTSLDQDLAGSDIKAAFQKSGIFLEASLASGSPPPGSGSPSSLAGIPDLKAALIVLRQTLQSVIGASGATADGTSGAAATLARATADEAAPLHVAAQAPSLAPSSSPEFDVQEILLPQARLPVAEDLIQSSGAGRSALASALDAGPTAGATLNLLQEALRELGNPVRALATPRDIRNDDVTVHTNVPPPPFRGALPAPQPVASPSIASNMPLAAAAHHLLDDTDAALARQTLLQVASLPDRIDGSAPKIDPTAPRWNFEIPFVMPQGTAIAQFEISRDGGGQEVGVTQRVWRARFSLDVEPAGPVHALVSLSGDTTSVRMWAERPATAAQLRAGAPQLSQALSHAELKPGDIVIRDGTPPQPAPARAGHFVDRAL